MAICDCGRVVRVRPHSTVAHFWSGVDRSGGQGACWPWIGSTNFSGGYGQSHFHGKRIGAHRAAYILTHGPIPDGMWVLHHCDNPPCVNPAHLFLGSTTDNMRDAARKGRVGGIAQRRRSHCPQGHPYAGDNVRIAPRGDRTCRQCARDRERAKRAALTEAGLTARGTVRVYRTPGG